MQQHRDHLFINTVWVLQPTGGCHIKFSSPKICHLLCSLSSEFFDHTCRRHLDERGVRGGHGWPPSLRREVFNVRRRRASSSHVSNETYSEPNGTEDPRRLVSTAVAWRVSRKCLKRLAPVFLLLDRLPAKANKPWLPTCMPTRLHARMHAHTHTTVLRL